jgi:hypothetical protein
MAALMSVMFCAVIELAATVAIVVVSTVLFVRCAANSVCHAAIRSAYAIYVIAVTQPRRRRLDVIRLHIVRTGYTVRVWFEGRTLSSILNHEPFL